MSINTPKKHSLEELLKAFPAKSHEIIFICSEIYNPDGYTQAVLNQVVYGNTVLTPQVIFQKPEIYILHIDSGLFSDNTKLLYDSTCVFSYDMYNKYFRYGPLTTKEDTEFWIEAHGHWTINGDTESWVEAE